MAKVFIVFSGDYEQRMAYGAFTSLEKAEAFWCDWNAAKLKKYPYLEPDDQDIEELGLDEDAKNIYADAAD